VVSFCPQRVPAGQEWSFGPPPPPTKERNPTGKAIKRNDAHEVKGFVPQLCGSEPFGENVSHLVLRVLVDKLEVLGGKLFDKPIDVDAVCALKPSHTGVASIAHDLDHGFVVLMKGDPDLSVQE
jgi:hypothetical protein